MKQRTRDNFIYLGVGGIIVGALTFYVFYTDRTMGRIPKIPGPLLWGIFSTPGIVALILERFWEHRRRPALWGILVVAASTNVSAIFIAHRLHWNPPIVVWGFATGFCLIAVLLAVKKFMARGSSDRKNSL
jgi:FtsH-binding integral membrane protein